MYGFVTADGSIYTLNRYNHTISGGNLQGEWFYVSAQIIIGAPAVISFANGGVLQTSPVLRYLS